MCTAVVCQYVMPQEMVRETHKIKVIQKGCTWKEALQLILLRRHKSQPEQKDHGRLHSGACWLGVPGRSTARRGHGSFNECLES